MRHCCLRRGVLTLLAFLLVGVGTLSLPLHASSNDPILVLPRLAPDHVKPSVSPDGSLMAVPGAMGSVLVFNTNDGSVEKVLTGLTGGWRDVAFTPDGQYLVSVSAAGGWENNLTAIVWRTSNWSRHRRMQASLPDRLRSIAISPDARWLAVGGWNYLQVYDLTTGEKVTDLQQPGRYVHSLKFSPDGQYLASANGGTAAKLWRVSDWSEARTLAEGLPENVSMAYSPDGRYLALSAGSIVRVWSTSNWDAPLYTLDRGSFDSAVPVVFTADSQSLVTRWNTNTVKVFGAADGAEQRSIALSITYAPFLYGLAVGGSTDLYTGIYDQRELNLYCIEQYSLESGAKVRVILAPTTREVNSVAMSPDGNFVAYSITGGPTRIIKVSDGREQLSLAGGSAVWISPDGSKMLVRETGGAVMRSFPDGAELWRGATPWWGAAFSPNGSLVAMFHSGQPDKLYDANNGSVIRTLGAAGGDFHVRDFTFTRDGKYILGPGRQHGWNWDDRFRVWRVETGELKQVLGGWNMETVAVHPSGNLMVVAGGKWWYLKAIRDLGDTLEFTDILSKQGTDTVVNNDGIFRVRFDPTGSVFVTVAIDGSVKMWRTMDGMLERALNGPTEPVYDVSIARQDNDLIIAAGGWGGVAVWRVPMTWATNTPPSVQPIYPENGAAVSDWLLSFKATDPDSGDQLRFRVEVMSEDGTVVKRYDQTVDSSSFDKPFASSDEVVSVNLDSTLATGVYRWRVQVTDGWAWSGWSDERTFTLVKPSLPLGQFRTLTVEGGTWRGTVTVPEGATKLFLTARSVEAVQNHTMRLFFGGTKIAESAGADILIERDNPSAGDYEVEITPAAAGQIVVYAGTALPAVRLGQSYTGSIYHNDGYDWLQMDVPAGVRALQFTVEAPGNITDLEVWRGSIGSYERWSATQRFNPPVRLTINNPREGRYYIRVKDHGQLPQTQVRQYVLSLSGARANLTASATPGMASAGDEVAVEVRYANEGDVPASGVVLKCILPEGFDIVEGSLSEGGAYDSSTRTAQWNIGDLAAGASGSASFRVRVARDVAQGSNLTVRALLESSDLPESVQTDVAVWVGAPGVRFHNVHTMFNYVDVTVGGLSINREQGMPQVWLLFPLGTATSTEIAADEVKVSEDGTQVQARFALLEKVLEDVAPRLRISHPSIGTKEWQAPTLHVFGVNADVHYPKPFIRQGRRETFQIRVTNPNAVWDTPFVKVQLSLQNVPSDENLSVNYWVYDSQGREVARGTKPAGVSEIPLLLPQLAPGESATYSLVIQISDSRAQIRTRVEPMTLAVVFVVSEVAVIASWVGHRILQPGCEQALKRRLREDFALEGVDLTDEQINRLYNAYRQAGSFAAEWLSQLAAGATEQALKDFVKAKYGEKFQKAAEKAYQVAKGDHPLEILLSEIASQLAPDLDWALLPATTAVKAFLAEGQDCIEKGRELRRLADRLRSRKERKNLRVTRAWDPNAKSGTLGVDGFIPDGQSIDYTVYFENKADATASAEEVLIEDILDESLDDSTLEFTAFGFGNHMVTLSRPVGRLSQGVQVNNNLVVRVESNYDPSTRKLTVRFKGIDTRTGNHYEDGFLPPNANEPEGEGYISFRIRPKADVASGTRIVNKATITFDPHLGANPPMETNEHALTLDKQAPQVRIADMPAVQSKPTFTVGWEGSDDTSGVKQTEIWYSANGGAPQLWQVLQPGEGRQETGSATFTGKFGYTYRFYAVGEDKVGNRSPYPDQPQATTRVGTLPQISAGLKMVSLPVISEITDPKQVFGFDADKWAWYDPETKQYVRYPAAPAAALQVGKGFWARFSQEVTPNAKGDLPDDTQPFTIALKKGWNLIGNPWLVDLIWDVNAIQVMVNGQTKALKDASDIVEPYAWRWDGNAYQLVIDPSLLTGVDNKLPKWEGAWVFAWRDATLLIPPPQGNRLGRMAKKASEGWVAKLVAQMGTERGQGLFGINATAPLRITSPPSPPESAGEGVQVFFVDDKEQLVTADIREKGATKQEWTVLVKLPYRSEGRGDGSEEVTLTFDGIGYAPKDLSLWLVDTVTGKRLYLRTQQAYRFVPQRGERERRLKLIGEIGNERPLQVLGLKATTLRGRGMSIQFTLTKAAQTQVELLTLTGRRIATIESGQSRGAGQHQIFWQGRGMGEVPLPSGTLFMVRLLATDEEGRQVQATTVIRWR